MEVKSEDQQSNKVEEVVADLIQDHFDDELPARLVSDKMLDYTLRCIEGPFAGNFVYLNLTEDGELIGSDPETNTLYIENDGISGQHVRINYYMEDNQYHYIIKDLNSEQGTWLQTRAGHQIPIEDDMIFRIEDQIFQFKLIEEDSFDVVVEWLARIELRWIIKRLKQYDVKTLRDIKNLSPAFIDEIIEDEEEKARFKQAFETIDIDFPMDSPPKYLVIYNLTQDDMLAKVGWSGAVVTKSSELQEFAGNDKFGVDCIYNFELIVSFSQNRYFFFVSSTDPGKIYIKLLPMGKYKIIPNDVINIGNLDFLVQRFNTGTWSDRGTRTQNEDRIVAVQSLPLSRYFSVSFFAVFDGHGGDHCAQFLQDNLQEMVKDEFLYGDDQLDDADNFFEFLYNKLLFIIRDMDQQYFQYQGNGLESGSVGVVVLICGTKIISINIGDCRAILSREGKPVQLTVDHKPYFEQEKKRIIAAGGSVVDNRVNQKLAVSRSFGDFSFKKETLGTDIVTVDPDIRVWDINFLVDEFIVLGCDGLFDVFDNQKVVEMVRSKLLTNSIAEQDPQKVARQICLEAVEQSKDGKRGQSDNCSMIIILLTRGIPGADLNVSQ